MNDAVDLPDGWVVKPLGDAARLVADKVEPQTVPHASYVGLEHVEAHTMRLVGSGRGSDVESTKTRFSAGDVLYGKLRPYLNKVARPPFDGISSTDFLVFTESVDLDPGYLAQFLNQRSVANYSHHQSAGVELPRVTWKSLSALPIAFPPSKAEQRALVALIERARVLASSAHNHLGQARRAIERFRQAVLAAACSGRLTADWRTPNPAAAVPLPTSGRPLTSKGRAAAEPFAREDLPEIPETWRWVPLATVSDSVLGKMLDKAKNRGTPRPYLRNINVRWRGFDLTDLQEMRFEAGEKNRFGLRAGDVIVCEGGEPGRAAVWREVDSDMRFQKALHRVRCNDRLLPDWLVNVLQVHATSGRLASYFTGTGIAHLTGVSLARVPIPLPTIDEQHVIVRRVDALLQLADVLDARIDVASHQLDHSSQAVLAKAFRGELSIPAQDLRRPPGAAL